MSNDGRIEQMFVVRIWRDAGAGDRGYRGSVVHVSTKERTYFSELTDAMEFMRVRFDVKNSASGAPPTGAPDQSK